MNNKPKLCKHNIYCNSLIGERLYHYILYKEQRSLYLVIIKDFKTQ